MLRSCALLHSSAQPLIISKFLYDYAMTGHMDANLKEDLLVTEGHNEALVCL